MVFLGGSCGMTTWREDIAIPFLRKHHITFYNPQLPPGTEWSPDLIQVEADAKKYAQYNLFVINSQTSGIASMIEATKLVCESPHRIALVLEDFQTDDPLQFHTVKDVNRGRKFLKSILDEYGLQVHTSIQSALDDIKFQLSTRGEEYTI